MPIPQVTDRIKEAPAVVLRAVFAGIGQLLMAVDKIRAQSQEQHTSPAPAGRNGTGPAQPANGAGNVTQLRERATATAARPAAAQADTPPAPPAAAKRATAPKSTAKPAAAAKAATTPKPAPGAKPAATVKPADTAKPAATPKPAAGPKPATAAKPTGAKPTTAKPTTAKRTAAEPAAAKPAAKPAAVKPAAAPEPAAAQPASAAAPAAPIPGYDDLSVASLRARLRGLDADGVQALLAYEKTHARRDDVITMFERRLSKIEDEAR
jgi:hypothetical protein